MERILTLAQMRDADKYTIDKLGVSEQELIYRAGTNIADVIKEKFLGGRVLVCIGKGNNGKDGLVVADILSKIHGFSVCIFDVENDLISMFDNQYDIIIDCIFGTGLNKEIVGRYREIIEKINQSNSYVISCDIPSGINGNSGQVMGVAVKANMTIVIQDYKLGHFLGDGIDYCGELILKDIGISVWDDNFVRRIGNEDAKKLFEERNRNVHKGNFGKACVLGGSVDYSGSIMLSANALSCLNSGVGYTYLGVSNSLFNAFVGKNPECILIGVNDDKKGMILDVDTLNKFLKCNSIAVGMGMMPSVETYEIIRYLLSNYEGNLIIDADGLNSLSKYGVETLKNKKCKVVLTPHLGEFSRLINLDKSMIIDNIIEYAVNFAKEYDIVLALKSAVSIITDGNETYLNTTGCAGMAKAGSGDVLSGIIAGLSARHNSLLESVVVALYFFGKAGEFAQDINSEFCTNATKIIEQFPNVIKSL